MTQNLVACRLESNFVEPERFIPERWLKDEKNEFNAHKNPYLVLPFGHGMRACIARRLAEQNILVLMIRVSFFSDFSKCSLMIVCCIAYKN